MDLSEFDKNILLYLLNFVDIRTILIVGSVNKLFKSLCDRQLKRDEYIRSCGGKEIRDISFYKTIYSIFGDSVLPDTKPEEIISDGKFYRYIEGIGDIEHIKQAFIDTQISLDGTPYKGVNQIRFFSGILHIYSILNHYSCGRKNLSSLLLKHKLFRKGDTDFFACIHGLNEMIEYYYSECFGKGGRTIWKNSLTICLKICMEKNNLELAKLLYKKGARPDVLWWDTLSEHVDNEMFSWLTSIGYPPFEEIYDNPRENYVGFF